MTVGGAIEDLGGWGNRGSGKEGARVERVGVASSCLPTTSVVQTADQNLRCNKIHTAASVNNQNYAPRKSVAIRNGMQLSW